MKSHPFSKWTVVAPDFFSRGDRGGRWGGKVWGLTLHLVCGGWSALFVCTHLILYSTRWIVALKCSFWGHTRHCIVLLSFLYNHFNHSLNLYRALLQVNQPSMVEVKQVTCCATSLHAMFSTVLSLNSRSVMQFNAWIQLCVCYATLFSTSLVFILHEP